MEESAATRELSDDERRKRLLQHAKRKSKEWNIDDAINQVRHYFANDIEYPTCWEPKDDSRKRG